MNDIKAWLGTAAILFPFVAIIYMGGQAIAWSEETNAMCEKSGYDYMVYVDRLPYCAKQNGDGSSTVVPITKGKVNTLPSKAS